MKKFVVMIVSFILLMSVALGYTFTVNYNGNTTTKEYDEGTLVTVGIPERERARYTVTEGDVLLQILGNRRQFNMPARNVSLSIENIQKIRAVTGVNGNIEPSGITEVNRGSNATYTITPNANWKVIDVLVDRESVGARNSYTFENVTEDHIIEAIYRESTHKIKATATGSGTLTPIGDTVVDDGGSQTYTITPSDSWKIDSVVVDGENLGAITSYTFENVIEDHTIDVVFKRNTFTITASAGSNGTISPSGTTTVTYGANQTYTITPNDGYAIDITVDGKSVGSEFSYTFSNVTDDHTIAVTFVKPATKTVTTPGIVEYEIPATGIYFLEVWGAGGGNSSYGGKGGFTSGYRKFNKGEKVYICVGGAGSYSTSQASTGGYNGGGDASYANYSSGGGATHIAGITGTLSEIKAKNVSKVFIVAGGGGGCGWAYYSDVPTTYAGGNGGGSSGTTGSVKPGYSGGIGGSQTRGAAFGKGGSSRAGGGGGLYGGFAGSQEGAGGGGGSGWVFGVSSFTYGGVTYSYTQTVGGGLGRAKNGKARITFTAPASESYFPNRQQVYLYTGGIQTFTVPQDGIYKFTVLGAGGYDAVAGGKGGKSVGYKMLNKGQELYVVVGGRGGATNGGYNGGGASTYSGSSWGAGGGATHIAIKDANVATNKTLKDLGSANKSKILLVAGGGGGRAIWWPYDDDPEYTEPKNGGNGGGTSGTAGSSANGTGGAGGTSSSGYAFGVGGSGTTGGGGGLYGGKGGTSNKGAGGGGSGYIGGVPAFTYDGTTYSPSTEAGAGSRYAWGRAIIQLVKSI